MSTTRDPELEAIEQELRGKNQPYIEKPDDLPIHDGSTCFMDINRACGPDCRAYDTGVTPAQGPEVCTVLSSLMDLADGIKPFIEVAQTLRKARQDKVRTDAANAPVPDPTGGRKRT